MSSGRSAASAMKVDLRSTPAHFSLRSSLNSAVNPPFVADVSTGREKFAPTDRLTIAAEGLAESGETGFLPTTIERTNPIWRCADFL